MTEAPTELILVGRVSGVFGVRGAIKVYSYTDPRTNIYLYSPWYLQDSAGSRRVAVRRGQAQGTNIIVELDDITERDAALALVGAEIRIRRDSLVPTVPGEYYWSDLEGLTVRTTDGVLLGRVDHLMATGSNDVLVVQGDSRRLIPFLYGSVIREVDLTGRVITVDWVDD
jgi:16S rRNA processing protein RimM